MCRKLINKKTRGFSLVELMVVVAIMGVLASIAIPSYNSYRKSAKKNAYRTDLLSLHKGWLAFGVEQDSFCERDTSPEEATINNVGMQSLISSKLYGLPNTSTLVQCSGCTSASDNGIYNNGHTCGAGCTTAAPSGTGPGKHNFIGFGTESCGNISSVNNIQVLGSEGGTRTTNETRCTLAVTSYEMGVGGHLSGNTYIGIKVDDDGVVEEQDEDTSTNVFSTSHANGVCA